MSDRLPRVDNLCTNPENHKFHVCELKAAGKEEDLARLARDPTFVCGNCGTGANAEGTLCAPGPLEA